MTDTLPLPLSELPLRRNSDKALRKAARADDLSAFRIALAKLLSRPRKAVRKLLPEPVWPRLIRQFAATDADTEFAAQGSAEAEAVAWLIGTSVEEPWSSLQAGVAAEILLRSSSELSDEQVSGLYVRLAIASSDVMEWQPTELTTDLNDPPDAGLRIGTAIAQRLLELGEVPVLCAYVLSDLKTSRSLCRDAMGNLAAILDESTDTDGLLHGNVQHVADRFLGSFSRVSIYAESFGEPWGTSRTLNRWQKTVSLAALQCDNCGLMLATKADTSPKDTLGELRSAAKVLDVDTPAEKLLKSIVKRQPGDPVDRPKSRQLKPATGAQSDWAEAGLLRDRWDVSGNAVAASWPQSNVQVAFSCLGTRLFAGDWNYETHVDGTLCQPAGNWVCTCWFEDSDVAFLELERGSTDGTRHVRQIVLVLNASLALLTDSITTSGPDAQVEYRSSLPKFADSKLQLQTNSVTRELRGNTAFADLRLVPLWLPDDRIQSGSGDLSFHDRRVSISESGTGGVTVPLLFDWSRVRTAAEADWNRLTVTEDRERLTGHAASGFRVRIGRLQLLVYRSLRVGATLRAVLGYNTSSETVYGRVANSGRIAPLVMVESDVADET